MKILKRNLKKGEIKLRIENLDDLWYLSQIIDSNDLVSGSTLRKIKISGGSGGHRGIHSIITLLKDDTFIRIRVGIGKPSPHMDHSKFVLSPFNETEQKSLKQVINKAQDCLETVIAHGHEAAMNKFHCKRQ